MISNKLLAGVFAAATLATSAAQGAEYPERPIQMVVPWVQAVAPMP